jgi:hypothetical protein
VLGRARLISAPPRSGPDPVFILAPGRSFTSVVCSMLGQHPEMCGVPELNLSVADTMRAWWRWSSMGRGFLAHGLVRTVAELYFGAQTSANAWLARRWIRRRLSWQTAEVFRTLEREIHPLRLVEKSVITVSNPAFLLRLHDAFPSARFLQLVRHPRSTCRSMLRTRWARLLVASAGSYDLDTTPPTLDPQIVWYEFHTNISRFLAGLPDDRKLRVRGEDLLARPDRHLGAIVAWLGARTDAAAIEQMKHPERSPFASLGPPGARFGNDPSFLRSPALRPYTEAPQRLEGPLEWRPDAAGFRPEVVQLARDLGYE